MNKERIYVVGKRIEKDEIKEQKTIDTFETYTKALSFCRTLSWIWLDDDCSEYMLVIEVRGF